MKKSGFILFCVIVLGGGLYWGAQVLIDAGRNTEDRPLTQGEVQRRNIASHLTFIGEITPDNQVKIRSEVSGRIEELNGEVGDRVDKGQLLVRLDERILLNEKRRLEIDISTARFQTAIAERNYKELEGLSGEFASRNEVLNREAELNISKNDIKRLEMRLEEVQEKLRKVRIVSPISGTILSVGSKEGEVVAGAESASGGSVIMQIADLENLVVTGQVNQADIGRITIGTKGQARSMLDVKVRTPCEIIGIDPVAQKDDSGSRSFNVMLRLLKVHRDLKPGMTTRVHFPMERAEGVVAAPVHAVFGAGRDRYVYKVVKAGSYEKVFVETGVAGLNFIEVTEGLAEGDVILFEDPAADNPVVERGRLNMRGSSTKNKKKKKGK